MNLAQLKKIITKALREAEDHALEEGIDVTTPEFKEGLKIIRNKLLIELGSSADEYEAYLESLKDIGRAKKEKKEQELDIKLDELRAGLEMKIPVVEPVTFEGLPDKPKILTKEDVLALIVSALDKLPKPEPAQSKSFLTIERPVNQITQVVEYDDSGINERLRGVQRLIEGLKIPPEVDADALKEDLKGYFNETLAHNINILGMPDFRKLAMGLQAQIDELRSNTGGVSDHGALTGLGDDDHTQYALLLGRSGGQTLIGGTAANDDITIKGTSNGTTASSYVVLQPSGGKVAIGQSTATATLDILAGASTVGMRLQGSGSDALQVWKSDGSRKEFAFESGGFFTLGPDFIEGDTYFLLDSISSTTGPGIAVGNVVVSQAGMIVRNINDVFPSFYVQSETTQDYFNANDTFRVDSSYNILTTGYLLAPTHHGSAASGENLTLSSTAHATKGKILFGTSAYDEVNNRLGIGQASPTAALHLKAGTTSASTAPLKFTSGTSLTSAEAGAMEYTTDDLFFTIATGTARKRLIMADPSGGLTSGRVPFATTNGRLTDDADLTFATDTLTATKVVGTTSIKIGTAGGYLSSDGSAGISATRDINDDSDGLLHRLVWKDGLLVSDSLV